MSAGGRGGAFALCEGLPRANARHSYAPGLKNLGFPLQPRVLYTPFSATYPFERERELGDDLMRFPAWVHSSFALQIFLLELA